MFEKILFLSKESKFYLLIWICAVFYSIYKFIVSSNEFFQNYTDYYEDFIEDLHYSGLPRRDKADFEWETINYYIKTVIIGKIIYHCGFELLRWYSVNLKILQFYQFAYSIVYLIYYLNVSVTFLIILQPLLFYYILKNRKTTLQVWIINLFTLSLIIFFKILCSYESVLNNLQLNYYTAYLTILLCCWMNLKCTSYLLKNYSSKNRSFIDFNYFSYCFYFPTLFSGPFIDFEDFKPIYTNNDQFEEKITLRLLKLLKNLIRTLFWLLFLNIALSFIYVNAASFQLHLINSLDLSSLCGYGYLMGQFFHIKYVVFYGFSTSFVAFDNIIRKVPNLPRCIARIHLYSEMWKYFDPGLYSFLKTYIFIPAQNLGVNKIGAQFLSFAFVYFWHGIQDYLLIWAMLNYIGIVVETVILKKNWKIFKKISKQQIRRIKCAVAAPLLALSAISNFYFFAGKDIGDLFFWKIITESFWNKLLVLCILYCCCQVSTDFRAINSHNTKK